MERWSTMAAKAFTFVAPKKKKKKKSHDFALTPHWLAMDGSNLTCAQDEIDGFISV